MNVAFESTGMANRDARGAHIAFNATVDLQIALAQEIPLNDQFLADDRGHLL